MPLAVVGVQAALAELPLVGTCIAAFQNIYVSREVVNRGKGHRRETAAGVLLVSLSVAFSK